MLDSELIIEVSKPNVVKLASVIGDEHERNSEPDNNILLNEFPYLGLGDRSQWLNFHLLGEVIHDHNEKLLL